MFWGSGPCIRSHASAGHLVVYFVTGQMVGDRRSPGADNTGGETIYLLSQPSLFSPADRFSTSWWIFLPVHRDGFFCVLGLRFALPCGVAASLWPTVEAAASPASTTLRRQRAEASVENGVSLIDRIQRSFEESFFWQLARLKSRSCPCSLSRLSCDHVTHRRALAKLSEFSLLVAVITWHCSFLWQSMMLQALEQVV